MNKKLFFLTTLLFLNMCFLFAQLQTWEPTIKITPADRAASDVFGRSVDIDGDYAIVGAYRQDEDANGQNPLNNAGAAYIYKKEGDIWVQQQKLVPAERYASDQFGSNVAISGDYAIVGSRGRDTGEDYGAVYVFKREGELWVEKQKLVSPVRRVQNFGFNDDANSIDIDGDYIVIGSWRDNGDENEYEELYSFQPFPDLYPDYWFEDYLYKYAGGVYIFKREGDIWAQQQKILASDRTAGDRFGGSVAISGNRIIVGAYYETEDANGEHTLSQAGSAYIFELDENAWAEQQKIVASDRTASDLFALSVSINGDYAAAGAHQNDTDANGNVVNNAGAAYIFYYNGSTWNQQQKITPNDRYANDSFGYRCVDIDGDRIVVGAYYEDEDEEGQNTINNAGSAYVFKRNGTEWTQELKFVAWDRNYTNTNFGWDLAMDNGVIIAAAPGERLDADGQNELSGAGASYIFTLVCPEIATPIVEAIDAVCAGSPVTLTAAVSEDNTTNWYESADSTEILHTGSVYTIESLTETTTFWVEAVTSEGCASERIPLVAAANPLPELTVLTPTAETCEGSQTTLEAAVETGHIAVWYDSPDAEEWIEQGTEFITPELTETTSYWVQAYNPETHCVSERIEIVITILPVPVLNIETTEFVFCSEDSIELFAASPGNVIFWYANEDDDEYTYHGNLFTPEITESTTYWVEAYNILTGCSSERIEVTVTINPVPDAPIAVSYQTVEEGTTLADLDVEADGTLTWYANEALSVVLPETTLVEENTIYYVTQTIAGCESPAAEVSVEFLGLTDIYRNSLAVYPNPTAGIVKIQSKAAVSNIEVFSVSGQRVTSVKAANEVNLSGYSSGTYILRITLENGEVVTKKVIKK